MVDGRTEPAAWRWSSTLGIARKRSGPDIDEPARGRRLGCGDAVGVELQRPIAAHQVLLAPGTRHAGASSESGWASSRTTLAGSRDDVNERFAVGRIVEQGSPRQVFDAPTTERTRDFLSHLGWRGATL